MMRRFYFLCCLAIVSVVSLGLHAESLSPATRQEIFHSVWLSADRWYPYFREKDINWKQVRQDYAPRVQAAADDQAFYQLLVEMLRELHDGHTAILSYPHTAVAKGMPPIRLVESTGHVFVAHVSPGTAAAGGVQPGMELTRVDGRPVEEMIQQLMPRFTASTQAYARHLAVLNLLTGLLNSRVDIEFANGQQISLERQRYSPVEYASSASARILPGNIGYLRVPHFRKQPNIIPQVDVALNTIRGTRAIIIDVRSNPGGYTRSAAAVAGRFFKQRAVFTTFSRRQYLLGVSVRTPRLTFAVNPRGWRYLRPVVVLTDPLVFSSAEFFVAGMKDTGRAVIIGQTTAGSSGNPKEFHAGPVHYRISTWREYRHDGRLIEGYGVEPDILVTPTAEELRVGTDSTLQTALGYLSRTLDATPGSF